MQFSRRTSTFAALFNNKNKMLGFQFRFETLYSQHSKILLTECLPLLYNLIIYF